MPERLVDETNTEKQTRADEEVTVTTPGVDDSERWEEDEADENHSPELEKVDVSIGVRGLGRYCRRRNRIETASLPTGHITLRRVMPKFDESINY